jgi:hypothetical protein
VRRVRALRPKSGERHWNRSAGGAQSSDTGLVLRWTGSEAADLIGTGAEAFAAD